MKAELLRVKIANATVSVPVCDDEETTREVARKVTERIEAIEESTGRIDSQAFALRAAYEFAMALHEFKKNVQADEQQIAAALDAVAGRLDTLAKEFAITDKA